MLFGSMCCMELEYTGNCTKNNAFHRASRHHLLLQTIIVFATPAYSFHTSLLIDFLVQPMKTEESTPIAARMSKADITQFQECKAWYEECKKIRCTIEDIGFIEETKHEIWLTFLYYPLKRYIVEGKLSFALTMSSAL